MLAQVKSGPVVAFNKKLQDELVKLASKSQERIYDFVAEKHQNEDSQKRNDEARQQNNARLCQILKEFGWPTSALVGKDGVGATLYLVRNSRQPDLQLDL